MHCGAHLAQERHHYEALGAQTVVWVEGSEVTFAAMQQSLKEDRAAGVLKAEHIAAHGLLYREAGKRLRLHGFSNDGESNSILHSVDGFSERWPHISETGESEVHLSTTIDAVVETHCPQGADLLVLDLQGAELDVLPGGSKTVASAKAIICEVSKIPLYEGGATYRDVVGFFASAGFIDMHRAHTVGDVLFLRRELL